MLAAAQGATECVNVLMDYVYLDVNKKMHKYGLTAMHLACRGGHLDIVKRLAEKGASIER